MDYLILGVDRADFIDRGEADYTDVECTLHGTEFGLNSFFCI